ncbi:MAG: hypothetical protein JST26_20895 [Bacteroidetes bacterium]|nr:hypothetical protein [Bacteroidota bacterium]
MKKLSFVILLFLGIQLTGQNNATFNELTKIIHDKFPELNISNKLISVCIWSSDNQTSRETNKEYQRLYNMYQNAILKDGRRGMVFISISSDKNETFFNIAVQKDGITKTIAITDLKGAEAGMIKALGMQSPGNAIYSSKGELFFKDLNKSNLQASVVSLLTR